MANCSSYVGVIKPGPKNSSHYSNGAILLDAIKTLGDRTLHICTEEVYKRTPTCTTIYNYCTSCLFSF